MYAIVTATAAWLLRDYVALVVTRKFDRRKDAVPVLSLLFTAVSAFFYGFIHAVDPPSTRGV